MVKGRPTTSPEGNAVLHFTEPKGVERSARHLLKVEPIQDQALAALLQDEVNTEEEDGPEENQEPAAKPRSPRLCEIIAGRF